MKPCCATTMLLVLGLVFGSGGCVSMGRDFDASRVSEIKEGQTTEAELISMFGNPNNRATGTGQATQLTWMYTHHRTKPGTYVPVVGTFIGGADTEQRMLTVNLDSEGVVTSYSVSGGDTEMRHMRN